MIGKYKDKLKGIEKDIKDILKQEEQEKQVSTDWRRWFVRNLMYSVAVLFI